MQKLNMANSLDVLTLLFNAAAEVQSANCLFLLDENTSTNQLDHLSRFDAPYVISNRFDIYQHALTVVKDSNRVYFSDFDVQALPEHFFDCIVYRVSKEKALTHWCLNTISERLSPSGKLLVGGKKEDGLKSYVKNCNKQLGLRGKEKKYGNNYLAHLRPCADFSREESNKLDDKNYKDLRTIGEAFGSALQSKPGLFGWDKIDEGSALLAHCLKHYLQQENCQSAEMSALDLGCGYGYLALALHDANFKRIIATDNNAAALLCCQLNLSLAGSADFEVIASDCGDKLQERVDFILCNPPFHSGFDNDTALTSKFVEAASMRLKPGGSALFVVNAFIPIEKVAKRYFKRCEALHNNKRFKVLLLQ